ncbi:MAG: HD domain-containing phosphohydrolase [Solirubrobacteraceae bacterium]|nr:HD domain-containing protein [Patulibacter sp.]
MDRPAPSPALHAGAAGWLQPLRRQFASQRVLLALSAAPPALAIASSNGVTHSTPVARAALVGISAAILVIVTITTSVQARRRPDTRSALMSVSFLAMAIVLVARVVAMVPGPLWSPGISRVGEMATLPLGALVLAMSAAPELRQRRRVELVAQSGPALGLFMSVALILVFSAADSVRPIPRPGSDAALAVFAGGAFLLGVLARRAARTAVLTERRSDFVVASGAIASIFAFWGIANALRNTTLWWTAHVLELFGLAAMCIPAARDLRRQSSSRPLVGDLRASDIVADEESFLDGRVHHLMLQLGRKDDVTEDHTRRVATLAVKMGEHLGLDPAALRDLAAGGLLHDIGKLQTPDQILKKPAALTDAEYEIIKRHPAEGRRMLSSVGRFNERVLHLVESHHERLDGGGYPNGAPASSIYLEARILAVADVFDALTSQRPYRVAWPADRAFEVIERESGSAFDPRCVEALREVIGLHKYRRALPTPWRDRDGGKHSGKVA